MEGSLERDCNLQRFLPVSWRAGRDVPRGGAPIFQWIGVFRVCLGVCMCVFKGRKWEQEANHSHLIIKHPPVPHDLHCLASTHTDKIRAICSLFISVEGEGSGFMDWQSQHPSKLTFLGLALAARTLKLEQTKFLKLAMYWVYTGMHMTSSVILKVPALNQKLADCHNFCYCLTIALQSGMTEIAVAKTAYSEREDLVSSTWFLIWTERDAAGDHFFLRP